MLKLFKRYLRRRKRRKNPQLHIDIIAKNITSNQKKIK